MSLALASNLLPTTPTEDSELTAEELALFQGDFENVLSLLPKWRFNGHAGIFADAKAWKADPNPDKYPRSLSGVVLAFAYSQGLNRTDEEEEAGIYSENWLCYAANISHAPRINADLPPDQQARVKARGAGVDCKKCPLARFNEELGKAPCSRGIRLLIRLMADEHGPARTVILTVSGYSAGALNKFIDEEWKQRNRPCIGTLVNLSRRSESKQQGGKTQNYYVATFTAQEDIPQSHWRQFLNLRKASIDSFERPDESDLAEERTASNAPSSEAPPAPAAQGKLQLDENGEPIYDGDPPKAQGLFGGRILDADSAPSKAPPGAAWGAPGTPEAEKAPPPSDTDMF